MRYSLESVIYFVVISGLGLLVFIEWNAWEKHSDEFDTSLSKFHEVDQSPDTTRRLQKIKRCNSTLFPTTGGPGYAGVQIADTETGSVLAVVCHESIVSCKFVDDDLIMVLLLGNNGKTKTRYYTRSHPEWWWGHFYRPEVCMLMFICTLFFMQLIKKKKQLDMCIEN